MGGERASKTRQREAGTICCSCSSLLDSLPWQSRERYCDRCAPTRPVAMNFFVRGAGEWIVNFLEKDMITPVGRIRRFGSAEKVRELVGRTPTRWVLADKQAFEYALKHGRGCVHLVLTTEQYQKLRG